MVLNHPTGIKSGEPCEHEDLHMIVGRGRTLDLEEFLLIQCYECWDTWEVWKSDDFGDRMTGG